MGVHTPALFQEPIRCRTVPLRCLCAEVTLTRAITPEMYTVGLGRLENRWGKEDLMNDSHKGKKSKAAVESPA